MKLGILLAGLLIPIIASAAYVESAAANVNGVSSKRHEKFVPMVTFKCGFRNQYLQEDGTWKSDENRFATCFSGKLDILKYCRKAYPSLNITNIVEYSHEVTTGNWCREEGSPCKWTQTTRPFQCIDGDFRSEALQVPHDCLFSHVNIRDHCNDYSYWKEEATKQCASKKEKQVVLRSFAVLEPCSIDMFTGVEFVCCPNDQPLKEEIRKRLSDDDDKDDDDDSLDEDYTEDDSDDADEEAEQDPYFKAANWTHEHEDFKDAEERMDSRHRNKIDKVMKQWADLEARYTEMKTKDPSGAEKFKEQMTSRFQKTVASLEQEHKRMKKEVEAVHEERVQTLLNEKKRDATHDYRQALSTHVNTPNKHNVLQKLKIYIRTEEKDRMHTLNRYRHLLRTDADDAQKFRSTVLHRLRYIDLRINGTLAMLRDFPDLERYVRPIAISYWQDYRRENTPELADDMISALNSLDEDAKNKKLVDLYTEQYEKLHPLMKLDVKAPTTTTTTEAPKKEADKEARLLPTETSDSEEQNDDFYEDEDDEEIKKKEPVKKVRLIDIKPKTASKKVEAPKIVVTSAHAADADDSSFSSESEEDNEDDKSFKDLRVDIEPIIEERPAFYRHEKLVQSEGMRGESFASSSTYLFLMVSIAVVGAVGFLVSMNRRRRAMNGFIEVDVYTPEERHVAGMQVNGYENPTYSFFDSKA
ncbi:unnamed protein product [Caenorhabditis auriculariae]|uniref:A4_EXTRA domain-containing protein n=1 Tax=Caenorhabditis auriculariae TaxID=2777116 RepID=A0A8S1H649_9PELO|nr:unnamed protein product [Caenorhabditis auriculariae]